MYQQQQQQPRPSIPALAVLEASIQDGAQPGTYGLAMGSTIGGDASLLGTYRDSEGDSSIGSHLLTARSDRSQVYEEHWQRPHVMSSRTHPESPDTQTFRVHTKHSPLDSLRRTPSGNVAPDGYDDEAGADEFGQELMRSVKDRSLSGRFHRTDSEAGGMRTSSSSFHASPLTSTFGGSAFAGGGVGGGATLRRSGGSNVSSILKRKKSSVASVYYQQHKEKKTTMLQKIKMCLVQHHKIGEPKTDTLNHEYSAKMSAKDLREQLQRAEELEEDIAMGLVRGDNNDYGSDNSSFASGDGLLSYGRRPGAFTGDDNNSSPRGLGNSDNSLPPIGSLDGTVNSGATIAAHSSLAGTAAVSQAPSQLSNLHTIKSRVHPARMMMGRTEYSSTQATGPNSNMTKTDLRPDVGGALGTPQSSTFSVTFASSPGFNGSSGATKPRHNYAEKVELHMTTPQARRRQSVGRDLLPSLSPSSLGGGTATTSGPTIQNTQSSVLFDADGSATFSNNGGGGSPLSASKVRVEARRLPKGVRPTSFDPDSLSEISERLIRSKKPSQKLQELQESTKLDRAKIAARIARERETLPRSDYLERKQRRLNGEETLAQQIEHRKARDAILEATGAPKIKVAPIPDPLEAFADKKKKPDARPEEYSIPITVVDDLDVLSGSPSPREESKISQTASTNSSIVPTVHTAITTDQGNFLGVSGNNQSQQASAPVSGRTGRAAGRSPGAVTFQLGDDVSPLLPMWNSDDAPTGVQPPRMELSESGSDVASPLGSPLGGTATFLDASRSSGGTSPLLRVDTRPQSREPTANTVSPPYQSRASTAPGVDASIGQVTVSFDLDGDSPLPLAATRPPALQTTGTYVPQDSDSYHHGTSDIDRTLMRDAKGKDGLQIYSFEVNALRRQARSEAREGSMPNQQQRSDGSLTNLFGAKALGTPTGPQHTSTFSKPEHEMFSPALLKMKEKLRELEKTEAEKSMGTSMGSISGVDTELSYRRRKKLGDSAALSGDQQNDDNSTSNGDLHGMHGRSINERRRRNPSKWQRYETPPFSSSLLTYEEAISAESEALPDERELNIPLQDLHLYQLFCAHRRMTIILRPVSYAVPNLYAGNAFLHRKYCDKQGVPQPQPNMSLEEIKRNTVFECRAKGKSISVSLKSSSYPPIDGLIPVNPALGKAYLEAQKREREIEDMILNAQGGVMTVALLRKLKAQKAQAGSLTAAFVRDIQKALKASDEKCNKLLEAYKEEVVSTIDKAAISRKYIDLFNEAQFLGTTEAKWRTFSVYYTQLEGDKVLRDEQDVPIFHIRKNPAVMRRPARSPKSDNDSGLPTPTATNGNMDHSFSTTAEKLSSPLTATVEDLVVNNNDGLPPSMRKPIDFEPKYYEYDPVEMDIKKEPLSDPVQLGQLKPVQVVTHRTFYIASTTMRLEEEEEAYIIGPDFDGLAYAPNLWAESRFENGVDTATLDEIAAQQNAGKKQQPLAPKKAASFRKKATDDSAAAAATAASDDHSNDQQQSGDLQQSVNLMPIDSGVGQQLSLGGQLLSGVVNPFNQEPVDPLTIKGWNVEKHIRKAHEDTKPELKQGMGLVTEGDVDHILEMRSLTAWKQNHGYESGNTIKSQPLGRGTYVCITPNCIRLLNSFTEIIGYYRQAWQDGTPLLLNPNWKVCIDPTDCLPVPYGEELALPIIDDCGWATFLLNVDQLKSTTTTQESLQAEFTTMEARVAEKERLRQQGYKKAHKGVTDHVKEELLSELCLVLDKKHMAQLFFDIRRWQLFPALFVQKAGFMGHMELAAEEQFEEYREKIVKEKLVEYERNEALFNTLHPNCTFLPLLSSFVRPDPPDSNDHHHSASVTLQSMSTWREAMRDVERGSVSVSGAGGQGAASSRSSGVGGGGSSGDPLVSNVSHSFVSFPHEETFGESIHSASESMSKSLVGLQNYGLVEKVLKKKQLERKQQKQKEGDHGDHHHQKKSAPSSRRESHRSAASGSSESPNSDKHHH